MSDILESLKDAVNPSRRKDATTETYDPQTRGPYADPSKTGDGHPELAPPAPAPAAGDESHAPARAEQTDLSTAGDGASPKRSANAGYGAARGTDGRDRSSDGN